LTEKVATKQPEPGPSRIVLLVEFADGAYRQFAAGQPCGYALAIEASGSPQEPRITVTFAGNPEAGGMRVSQGGLPR
jgi:hypothetical protein